MEFIFETEYSGKALTVMARPQESQSGVYEKKVKERSCQDA